MEQDLGKIIGEINFKNEIEGTIDDEEIIGAISFLSQVNPGEELINDENVVRKLSFTNSDGSIVEELDIVSIIRTDKSIFLLLENGTVYGCGSNAQYELGGIEDRKFITKFVKLNVSNVKKVVVGGNHTMFLLNNGRVKACGRNYEGQLGIGHFKAVPGIFDLPIQNVKDIFCGKNNTMFLLEDGIVKGCGYNEQGQLGIDNDENQCSIVAIPITNVNYISLSRTNTIFMMNDGTMKACGSNRYGELGIGDEDLEGIDDIIDLPLEIEKEEDNNEEIVR